MNSACKVDRDSGSGRSEVKDRIRLNEVRFLDRVEREESGDGGGDISFSPRWLFSVFRTAEGGKRNSGVLYAFESGSFVINRNES